MIGTVGSENRMDSTVLGDAVNLASRLEALTKNYRCPMLVSEDTKNLLADQEEFHWRMLDQVMVKGKNDPVKIFEVLDPNSDPAFESKMKVAEMFENSREFYIQQDWNPAIEGFQECLNLLPKDAALEMHLDRARSFALSNPPENWDGVHQYFEK